MLSISRSVASAPIPGCPRRLIPPPLLGATFSRDASAAPPHPRVRRCCPSTRPFIRRDAGRGPPPRTETRPIFCNTSRNGECRGMLRSVVDGGFHAGRTVGPHPPPVQHRAALQREVDHRLRSFLTKEQQAPLWSPRRGPESSRRLRSSRRARGSASARSGAPIRIAPRGATRRPGAGPAPPALWCGRARPFRTPRPGSRRGPARPCRR